MAVSGGLTNSYEKKSEKQRRKGKIYPFYCFLYFFALIAEESFLISPCYSLELCIQMGVSFLFSFFLSLSLSLPLFFRLIPWNAEALCIHLPAWASKTLLAFCVNQGISASFSPLFSYLQHSFLISL